MVPAEELFRAHHHPGAFSGQVPPSFGDIGLRGLGVVPPNHVLGEVGHRLEVVDQRRRAVQRNAAQLGIEVSVLPEQGDPRIAPEIHDLLGLRIGLEQDLAIHQGEPVRREVGAPVSVEGRRLHGLAGRDESPGVLVGHADAVAELGDGPSSGGTMQGQHQPVK